MDRSVTLLIPEKADIEFEEVATVWKNVGGQVKRLGKYWIKDENLVSRRIAIYGGQAFAFVLAQIYDVELLSPDDSLITRLEKIWTKRNVHLQQIGQLSERDFPVFIKPLVPKIFPAAIYNSKTEFIQATEGLPDSEQILASDIVTSIKAESRCYIKDGLVKDISFYEGSASLEEGVKFATDFVEHNKDHLPAVVVIDIGFNEQIGWFVIEFNACWGAGLNNCKAEKVIDCIIGATINK
jgi:hypothetical protein